jgi:formylglycine-generating enzyme required for sulfatase activity
MSGNVWEWTRSLYRPYPYQPGDGREKLFTESEYQRSRQKDAQGQDVDYALRGGAFSNNAVSARCAYRYGDFPNYWFRNYGFRVVVVGFSRASQSVSLVSGLRQMR